MGSFLIRFIIIAGVSIGVFFLVTGGNSVKFPEVSEEGFQIEFDDSYSVENMRNKVKGFFSGNSTTSIIYDTFGSTSTEPESDVEFFKNLLFQKNNVGDEIYDELTSKNLESDSSNKEQEEEKNFIEKIIDRFKNQLNGTVSKEDESENIFSEKQNNIPSFTTACFPDTKQVCSRNKCVEEFPKVEFTFLDKEKSIIAHCDSEGCVIYDAKYEEINGYENYQPIQPKGYIVNKEKDVSKNNRSEYTEIVISGVKTTIYSGYCLDREDE